MKERGILYTPDNIRAIREGRKTQTRRIMKVQPPSHDYQIATCVCTTGPRRHEGRQHWLKVDGYTVLDGSQPYFSCPYGVVGDRLYIKEGWYVGKGYDGLKGSELPDPKDVRLKVGYTVDGSKPEWAGRTRSGRFMPKRFARYWQELTEVRVERLQDISEADAIAEGIPHATVDIAVVGKHLVKGNLSIDRYARLWDSINAKQGHGWAVNEWVWVLTFKVIEP